MGATSAVESIIPGDRGQVTDKSEVVPGQKSSSGKFANTASPSGWFAFRICCDKNVIVLCSERGQVDQNASERASGKWLTDQIE